ERATGGVEVRLDEDHHPRPLLRAGHLEHLPGADHLRGDGCDRVPEGEEHGAAALLALGDLPLDPDPAEPGDPAADELQHGPHRNRRLRGRFKGHDPIPPRARTPQDGVAARQAGIMSHPAAIGGGVPSRNHLSRPADHAYSDGSHSFERLAVVGQRPEPVLKMWDTKGPYGGTKYPASF